MITSPKNTSALCKLQVGQQDIAYKVRGNGPPIVLVCTLSGSWANQVRALSEKYTVITYDMRNFGDSRVENIPYPSNEEHADDLLELICHLKLEKPLIIGLSHGGIILQHFGRKHQDSACGLVFVSTLAKPVGQTKLILSLLNDFLDDHDGGRFWKVLRTFLFSEARYDGFVAREKALRRLMFNQFTTNCLSNIYSGALRHDATSWLGGVSVRSLVIGGNEDVLFPPSQTRLLSSLLGNAKMKLMNVAHLPPIEDPCAFNEIVDSFYSELLHA